MSGGMIRNRAQWAEYTEVRNRLVSVGVCPDCKWRLARKNRVLCRICARRHRLQRRQRIGYQGAKRCRHCRRLGHDIRTCIRVEREDS